MRPSDKPTGAVWALFEKWSEGHPLHPNQSQMAGLFGVSSSLMSNWKFREALMQADDMRAISEATGIPFGVLAEAVNQDMPFVIEHNAARRSQSHRRKGTKEQRGD